MKLKKLSSQEFEEFSKTHPLTTFHQRESWGKLKKNNGWNYELIGFKDKGKVVAATLLLSKSMPLKLKMYYAPRGFLIDFSNTKLLDEFVKDLKEYIKNQGGTFLKIDPYIPHLERDINGEVVKGGFNNSFITKHLKKLGFIHRGYNIDIDKELQPRWIFVTDTKDKTIDDVMTKMDSKTRQIIRRNERLCIKIREINYEELYKFKDIMQHTGDRRNFIDRPLSYYQDMYKTLHPNGTLKILAAELHIKELINNYKSELDEYKNEYDERKHKHDNGINIMNEKKYQSKQKETQNNIDRIKNKLKETENLQKENGDILLLGGILFLINEKEVLSLVGGSYDKYMEYQSAYSVHWAGCKYAIEHGHERYNFYGISGGFDEKDPLFGLYLFKKGFGGKVIELIGEFDLIVNKPKYILYKISYLSYKRIKNLFNRLKNNT